MVEKDNEVAAKLQLLSSTAADMEKPEQAPPTAELGHMDDHSPPHTAATLASNSSSKDLQSKVDTPLLSRVSESPGSAVGNTQHREIPPSPTVVFDANREVSSFAKDPKNAGYYHKATEQYHKFSRDDRERSDQYMSPHAAHYSSPYPLDYRHGGVVSHPDMHYGDRHHHPHGSHSGAPRAYAPTKDHGPPHHGYHYHPSGHESHRAHHYQHPHRIVDPRQPSHGIPQEPMFFHPPPPGATVSEDQEDNLGRSSSGHSNVARAPTYEQLTRENYRLKEQLHEKELQVNSLQMRIDFMEKQNAELRQLPTGKISHIPIDDMMRIMKEYGSEVSDQTLPKRKDSIKKASIVRQFRRWNPEFFRYFVHVNGEWVPKLGREGELKRRVEKRRVMKTSRKAMLSDSASTSSSVQEKKLWSCD